jgi:hypothetical protein
MGIGEEFLDAAVSGFEVFDDRVDFDAVTGRQQHALLDP